MEHTFHDRGIFLPWGAAGEARTTCPQCSASRRKSYIACLAVNADTGAWFCHHCGWRGSLAGRQQSAPRHAPSSQPVEPDERKRASLRRAWSEACTITAADPIDSYLCHRGIMLDEI